MIQSSSPAQPLAGGLWSIVVWVSHERPSSVTITPPVFPSEFTLERTRNETRLFRESSAASEAGRWTSVEYLFTIHSAGTYTLASFEASVAGVKVTGEETTVVVKQASTPARNYAPRLRWVDSPQSIHASKESAFLLELYDWDPEKKAPEKLFLGKAPRSAIIEENPARAAGEGTYQYTINVIALEEGTVTIGPFSLAAGQYTLALPRLAVTVLPPLPDERSDLHLRTPEAERIPAAVAPGGEFFVPENPVFPFIPGSVKIFPLLKWEYSKAVKKAEALWNEQRWAEALAEIRRQERQSIAGPYLAPLRKNMEDSLGIVFTEDEVWRPLNAEPLFWAIAIFLVLLTITRALLYTFRSRRVPSDSEMTPLPLPRPKRGAVVTTIFVMLLIGILFVIFEGEDGRITHGRLITTGRAVVLKKTEAYRVPDASASVNSRFSEGQMLFVGNARGPWRYSESPDGRSGWVREEALITY